MLTIGNRTFETQKAAIDHTRDLLLTLEPYQIVSTDTEGYDYLTDLVKRHPDAASKIGKGVDAFYVHRSVTGHIALSIKRVDTSLVDVSWVTCVKAKPKTNRDNLLAAMRAAVQTQIADAKSTYTPNMNCEICDTPIKTLSDSHVDHKNPTFLEIANGFIAQNESPQVFDDDPVRNNAIFTKDDAEYQKRWQAYHHQHATLRLVHANCNLSRRKTEPDASIEQTHAELQTADGEFDSEAGDIQNFRNRQSAPAPSIPAKYDFYDYAGLQRSFNVRVLANEIWVGNYPKALDKLTRNTT